MTEFRVLGITVMQIGKSYTKSVSWNIFLLLFFNSFALNSQIVHLF